ncbi:T6SS immunity protein Tli3 family protein [Amantichitinum ursilacus]|uniref:Tli3-like domain-containing protein n=1 Tax=Amantichitinum ursilacus TaxID=857265 RepID=A0A0N0GLD4_9NEIS|nr:hypothetical protein [Amantichitinum ursilacus]KPC49884.1 hypothetical protein WG78_19100 [Amantichitinum ursilacus]
MKRAGYKAAGFLLAVAGAVLLNGCAIIALPGAAGAVGSTRSNSEWKGYPKYDVDPQVIYRIDDHRYVTMENYLDCKFANYVSGNQEVYYHHDRLGITTRLGTNRTAYQGKLIIDAPAGKNLAFPGSPWGVCTYGDKGCSVYIAYSADSGRTWNGLQYMHYAKSPAETRDYAVVVTDDALYIRHRDADPIKYPMGSQWNSAWGPGLGNQDFGSRLRAAMTAARQQDIPQEAIDDEGRYYDQLPLEERDAAMRRLSIFKRQVMATVPASRIPPEAHTPSGMDRLVCDPTITPRGVTYSKPAYSR